MFSSVLNNSSELDQMGVFSFPTSILIGKDGVIKAMHVGGFTTQSIEAEITPLLGH